MHMSESISTRAGVASCRRCLLTLNSCLRTSSTCLHGSADRALQFLQRAEMPAD